MAVLALVPLLKLSTVIQLCHLINHMSSLFISDFQVFTGVDWFVAVFSISLNVIQGCVLKLTDRILNLRQTTAAQVQQLLLERLIPVPKLLLWLLIIHPWQLATVAGPKFWGVDSLHMGRAHGRELLLVTRSVVHCESGYLTRCDCFNFYTFEIRRVLAGHK